MAGTELELRYFERVHSNFLFVSFDALGGFEVLSPGNSVTGSIVQGRTLPLGLTIFGNRKVRCIRTGVSERDEYYYTDFLTNP